MYYKLKKNKVRQVSEDNHSVPPESDKKQLKKMVASADSDKNANENVTVEVSKNTTLSEKFFLSEFTED